MTEQDKDYYINNLKHLLVEIADDKFFKMIKHRLMIEAVLEENFNLFQILYCSSEGINITDVKYHYVTLGKTHNLSHLLEEHPQKWTSIETLCR